MLQSLVGVRFFDKHRSVSLYFTNTVVGFGSPVGGSHDCSQDMLLPAVSRAYRYRIPFQTRFCDCPFGRATAYQEVTLMKRNVEVHNGRILLQPRAFPVCRCPYPCSATRRTNCAFSGLAPLTPLPQACTRKGCMVTGFTFYNANKVKMLTWLPVLLHALFPGADLHLESRSR